MVNNKQEVKGGDEKLFADRYYKAELPGSYSGASGLRGVLPRSSRGLKDWLKEQDAYTLHKTPRRRFMRRKTIVSGINDQWQTDLVDLSRLKSHNNGKKFVLTAIDVFSKVGYVASLKNKSSSEVIKALDTVFKKSSVGPPRRLQSDKGSEFRNAKVQQFLKKRGVVHFTSENADIKCAVVERWNRTILEKLYRYFTKANTRKYLQVLPKLVSAYNKTYHRSIGLAPLDVVKENEEQVWQRLYGDASVSEKVLKKAKLKVGDTVRLSESRRHFKKGYLASWTKETFVVTDVLNTSPRTYRVADESGEPLKGTFYMEELQLIKTPPDKLYKIEKVLKRGKNKVLVRWEGYPPSFDSWILKKELKKAV